MAKPLLCFGKVMHRRLRPVEHAFAYPLFFCLLPVDDLPSAQNRIFSLNRFNLFAFYDADHGGRDGSPLLPWIRQLLTSEGVAADGEIWLQCFPRILGYVFNPVSFWYCHDRDGRQMAILAEVNNTFGEHHLYLLKNADGTPLQEGQWLSAQKVFHVSPFFPMRGQYRFLFERSAERTSARIDYHDGEAESLRTAVWGEHHEWSAAALWRAFWRYPWMTAMVVVRIHWQALRLWLKRVPFFKKPQSPTQKLTP